MLNTWIARAFLYRMLRINERERLMHFEINMPPRRYLTAFEICRLFNLQPKPPTDTEIEEMKRIETEFKKILWKKRIIEYKAENPSLSNEELKDAVDSTLGADDRFEWQEFAAVHYRQPSGSFKGEPAAGREYV